MIPADGDPGRPPLVSVVMPAYNAEPFIAESIDSALRQTVTDVEVLVIDDGSTDRTMEIAGAIGEPVRVIEEKHGGPSHARNRGIREARGKYIAFLDADDIWHPDMLRFQLAEFERDPDLGLVYTNCWLTDGRALILVAKSARRRARTGMVFRDLLVENFIITPTVLVRRECFDRVGMFDTKISLSEDFDMWLRLSRHYRFGFVDRPLARHRRHGGGTFHDMDERVRSRQEILRKLQEEGPDGVPLDEGAATEFLFRLDYHMGVRHLEYGDRDAARRLLATAAHRHPLALGLFLRRLGARLPAVIYRMAVALKRIVRPTRYGHEVLRR